MDISGYKDSTTQKGNDYLKALLNRYHYTSDELNDVDKTLLEQQIKLTISSLMRDNVLDEELMREYSQLLGRQGINKGQLVDKIG